MKNLPFLGALFSCFFTFVLTATGQNKLPFSLKYACNWSGESINDDSIFLWDSDEEAREIIEKICKLESLEQNFAISAANVTSACAFFYDHQRHIFYSPTFIYNIEKATRNKWTAYSILAHEIGHLLNNNSIDSSAVREHEELVADQFSGNVMRRLGASLDDAQAAVKTLNYHDNRKYFYPSKSARLEAIAYGWLQADKSYRSAPVPAAPEKKANLLTDDNFCPLLQNIIKDGEKGFEHYLGNVTETGVLVDTYGTKLGFQNCRIAITKNRNGIAMTFYLYDGLDNDKANDIALHYAKLVADCTKKMYVPISYDIGLGVGKIYTYTFLGNNLIMVSSSIKGFFQGYYATCVIQGTNKP